MQSNISSIIVDSGHQTMWARLTAFSQSGRTRLADYVTQTDPRPINWKMICNAPSSFLLCCGLLLLLWIYSIYYSDALTDGQTDGCMGDRTFERRILAFIYSDLLSDVPWSVILMWPVRLTAVRLAALELNDWSGDRRSLIEYVILWSNFVTAWRWSMICLFMPLKCVLYWFKSQVTKDGCRWIECPIEFLCNPFFGQTLDWRCKDENLVDRKSFVNNRKHHYCQ